MDPSGVYSSSPASFSVTTVLTIEADIDKEYDCSDHFLVISSVDSFGVWAWSSEADRIKVVWNCDNLYIYAPVGSPSSPSSSLGIHHLVITYTPTSIQVVTDLDSVDLYVEGSYWEEVWLWVGADDDAGSGSDFTNVMVSSCEGIS